MKEKQKPVGSLKIMIIYYKQRKMKVFCSLLLWFCLSIKASLAWLELEWEIKTHHMRIKIFIMRWM